MNILVIGSSSFIASWFIESYSEKFSIKCISRNINGIHEIFHVSNYFDIPLSVFNDIDVVINFVAIVHQDRLKNFNTYIDVNYNLAIVNAQKAKNRGVKLFIQMSTIAVYGNASSISINTPANPKSPYGITKLKADEELLKIQNIDFKVAIIRPPMVYGGGNAPGNMMRLIKLVDKGIPLPFKCVDNLRDMINIHNLVQYISIIAEKQLNGIYLLSDKKPISTEYLINCIYTYLGKKNRLIKIPDMGLRLLKKIRTDEYDKLYGSLEIKTNFLFEYLINRYSVESGIHEMVDWYKSSRNLI